jgi:predicted DCC family thiol-disulfide oxidoreductase YuxK
MRNKSRVMYVIPSWLDRLSKRLPWFSERYLSLDARALGLMRIYLALLLLYNLWRRARVLEIWYTNSGVLPNHTLLWSPATRYQFSLFFSTSHVHEAAFLFGIFALIYLAFLVGYRTRLMHVLSFFALVSVHDRTIYVENGGDITLNLLTAWTLFLPMGARFSIDAIRESFSRHHERDESQFGDRSHLSPPLSRVTSLVVPAILAQVAIIYAFNALHKKGVTWMEGSAVHYVLHQDRIVTWLGQWVRPHVSAKLSAYLTWSALAVEFALPFLLLSPLTTRTTRRIAIVLGPMLHVGFAAFLNVGMFSANMIGWYFLLWDDGVFRLLGRWLGPSPRRARTVFFDADCGFCFFTVRVLARLDRFERLRFVSNRSPEAERDGIDPALIERTVVVVCPASGRRWTHAAAFAEIFRALPCGTPVAALLSLPLVSAIADGVYNLVARNRARISVAMGLPVCGIRGTHAAEARPSVDAPRLGSSVARVLANAREVGIVALFFILTSQLFNENWIVPRWLHHAQPTFVQMIVEYPRLREGWTMFAPDAPRTDAAISVDARTVDGRHVDPVNLVASRVAPVPMDGIPERLDEDEFWVDYLAKIAGTPAYHPALRDWILNHHRRTGRAEDRIVSFDVYLLEDDSPPPGTSKPLNTRQRLVFHGDASQ